MELLNKNSDELLSMGADPITYLRQLRSKFNQQSTHSLARLFSEFTWNLSLQPFSVFTLVNSTLKDDIDVLLGSRMMELAAHTILEGTTPVPLKKDVAYLFPATTTKNKEIIQIFELLKEDNEINILEARCESFSSIYCGNYRRLKKTNVVVDKNQL